MKFLDKRSNKIKNAYSIEESEGKILIRFTETGKTYAYNPENIEIIGKSQTVNSNRVYRFKQRCYQCGHETYIYT